MRAGTGRVTFTDQDYPAGLADLEVAALDAATGKELLAAVLPDELQAVQLALGVAHRHHEFAAR